MLGRGGGGAGAEPPSTNKFTRTITWVVWWRAGGQPPPLVKWVLMKSVLWVDR